MSPKSHRQLLGRQHSAEGADEGQHGSAIGTHVGFLYIVTCSSFCTVTRDSVPFWVHRVPPWPRGNLGNPSAPAACGSLSPVEGTWPLGVRRPPRVPEAVRSLGAAFVSLASERQQRLPVSLCSQWLRLECGCSGRSCGAATGGYSGFRARPCMRSAWLPPT